MVHIQLNGEVHMARRVNGQSTAALIASECLAVRVRTLNRAITLLYDEALRPHGLRVGQLNLLVAIAKMGSPTAGDLSRVLRMEKSTLSRDLELLHRHGWLDRLESTGRARPLRLSGAGQALLEGVVPAWSTAQDRARRLIGDEAANAILQVALKLQTSDSKDP